MEGGRAILSLSKAHSLPNRRISPVKTTTSRGVTSGAEQVFDTLLRDSVMEVFNGVLGRVAGQALLDAVKRDTSLEMMDLSRKPDLLDQRLVAHLGLAAKVLERRILNTLTSKTVAGVARHQADTFDFATEVEKVRKQFLERKQAAKQPQILE